MVSVFLFCIEYAEVDSNHKLSMGRLAMPTEREAVNLLSTRQSILLTRRQIGLSEGHCATRYNPLRVALGPCLVAPLHWQKNNRSSMGYSSKVQNTGHRESVLFTSSFFRDIMFLDGNKTRLYFLKRRNEK